ncbi:MAG: nucleotidyltransferase family protein [Ruminococcaceae bacterium]|nr:nucleotidyltransferase family protein [Oscillospiraceae bacterium]
MEIRPAAIAAEYNPFHNGHAYHISKTRELYGATHIVAIMSGCFVQRGDCACLRPHTRAQMAIASGADLVIQLPLPWALAPAERFARGAVHLADALGCVRLLSFGSESGDIDSLSLVAELSDKEETLDDLHKNLSRGMSYPAARQAALSSVAPQLSELIASPNDTLGIEYIRALKSFGSSIEPVCVKREGDRHDGNQPVDSYASASFLRNILQSVELNRYIPHKSLQLMTADLQAQKAPFLLSRLESAMLYRLRTMSKEEIASLPDLSEGLENRIYKAIRENCSISDIISAIKTKRYTHSRIRRILLSALLGINRTHCEGMPPYIRIMAMNKKGRELLSQPNLPVISRISDFEKLDDKCREIFELELKASDIFALAAPTPMECGSEARHRLTVV